MIRFLGPALLVIAACNGGSDTTPTTTDSGTSTSASTTPGVMRDCPATPGTICPWAGAGYDGWNGDNVDRLDAWFSFPMSIAFPPAGKGRPVLSDWNNHKLRAVNPNPADGFETIMGTNFLGDGDAYQQDRTTAGAPGTSVALNHPTQQTFWSDGTMVSASWHTHKIRTWDPTTGIVHVYLGDRPGFATDPNTGLPVDFDQDASTVLMNQPKQVLVDPVDENFMYILDMRNERIRVLDRNAWIVNTIAGETVDTNGDGALGSKGYCGEGDALKTCFAFPKNQNPEPGGGIAVTADDATMYIADSENHAIRKLDLLTGQISLYSGNPGHHGFQDGDAASALWSYPTSLALDSNTNQLFVADTNNQRVRVIDLDTGMVSTFAGNGQPSCDLGSGTGTGTTTGALLLDPAVCDNQHDGGDGGPATDATLYRPFGVDLDPDGNLIIADTYDHRFRVVYR